jgi:hypothetical protein
MRDQIRKYAEPALERLFTATQERLRAQHEAIDKGITEVLEPATARLQAAYPLPDANAT